MDLKNAKIAAFIPSDFSIYFQVKRRGMGEVFLVCHTVKRPFVDVNILLYQAVEIRCQ